MLESAKQLAAPMLVAAFVGMLQELDGSGEVSRKEVATVLEALGG
jgi:hypothetical protein